MGKMDYSHVYPSQMNFRCCCLHPLRNPHVFRIHSGCSGVRRLAEKSSGLGIACDHKISSKTNSAIFPDKPMGIHCQRKTYGFKTSDCMRARE